MRSVELEIVVGSADEIDGFGGVFGQHCDASGAQYVQSAPAVFSELFHDCSMARPHTENTCPDGTKEIFFMDINTGLDELIVYAKNNLLPPPNKKKYSKEHLLVLIFVYYFKNLLSIKDIEILLKPLTDKYFAVDSEFDMESIYEEVCKMEKSRIGELQDSIRKAYETAEHSFVCVDDEEREQLQKFAFICNLSFDVYVKKQLIEKMVDELPKPDKKK